MSHHLFVPHWSMSRHLYVPSLVNVSLPVRAPLVNVTPPVCTLIGPTVVVSIVLHILFCCRMRGLCCAPCQMETLEGVRKALRDECPRSLEDCVSWACHMWHDNYSNQIRQLLFNFPPEQVSPSSPHTPPSHTVCTSDTPATVQLPSGTSQSLFPPHTTLTHRMYIRYASCCSTSLRNKSVPLPPTHHPRTPYIHQIRQLLFNFPPEQVSPSSLPHTTHSHTVYTSDTPAAVQLPSGTSQSLFPPHTTLTHRMYIRYASYCSTSLRNKSVPLPPTHHPHTPYVHQIRQLLFNFPPEQVSPSSLPHTTHSHTVCNSDVSCFKRSYSIPHEVYINLTLFGNVITTFY